MPLVWFDGLVVRIHKQLPMIEKGHRADPTFGGPTPVTNTSLAVHAVQGATASLEGIAGGPSGASSSTANDAFMLPKAEAIPAR